MVSNNHVWFEKFSQIAQVGFRCSKTDHPVLSHIVQYFRLVVCVEIKVICGTLGYFMIPCSRNNLIA